VVVDAAEHPGNTARTHNDAAKMTAFFTGIRQAPRTA
jgi:hypothetical protein